MKAAISKAASQFVLLVCFLLLCTEAPAQEVVEVDNSPIWGDDLSLIEEIRIGAADGEMEYLFGSILAVRSLSDGSILVADRQVPAIRTYSPSGEYLGDIGTPGSGPGEYNNLMGLQVFTGDQLVVWDSSNRRLSYYDAHGGFLESHPVDSGLSGSDVLHVAGDGRAFVKDMIVEAGKDEHGNFPMEFIEIARNGEVEDRISVPPMSDEDGFVLIMNEGGRRAFYHERLHTISRDGRFIVGDNRSYTLDFMDDGRPVKRLTRGYEPVPVNDEEREQWDDVASWFLMRFSQDDPEYPSIPSTKPAFRKLKIDADGRIWVERYVDAVHRPEQGGGDRPSLDWREPPVFDVIEPDGTFLGQVRLPFGAYFHDARGRQVYAEYTDENDVPYVIRYRIESN